MSVFLKSPNVEVILIDKTETDIFMRARATIITDSGHEAQMDVTGNIPLMFARRMDESELEELLLRDVRSKLPPMQPDQHAENLTVDAQVLDKLRVRFGTSTSLTVDPTDPEVITPPLDTTPPEIHDLIIGMLTPTSLTVRWHTTEPTTGVIEYGPTAAYGMSSPQDPLYNTAHAAALVNLTPAIQYHYRVKSKDQAGNEVVSDDSVVTMPPAEVVTPIISNPQVTDLTSGSATVTWTTNIPTDSLVEYGTTTDYNMEATIDNTMVLEHAFPLEGLSPATEYHCRIRSADPTGAQDNSADITFTTLS